MAKYTQTSDVEHYFNDPNLICNGCCHAFLCCNEQQTADPDKKEAENKLSQCYSSTVIYVLLIYI